MKLLRYHHSGKANVCRTLTQAMNRNEVRNGAFILARIAVKRFYKSEENKSCTNNYVFLTSRIINLFKCNEAEAGIV